jgi:N-glycosylase/DNA lyase
MTNADAREELRLMYVEKKDLILTRLQEFKDVFEKGDDQRVFKELVFCILTSAVGPKVGLISVNAVNDILMDGSESEVYEHLQYVHKYPQRASYIVHTREYLKRDFNFKLKDLILSFSDSIERRDFFASNKDIRGIGYVQASHFLRNIGFCGYAILDKNVMQSLYKLGVVDNLKPPTTKKRYLEIEAKLKEFANKLDIGVDELDLLLWSRMKGYLPN